MRLFLICWFSFALLVTTATAALSEHPLAPLSESELKRAVVILKKKQLLGNGWYLQLLRLIEPTKEQVLFGDQRPITRDAFAIVMNTSKNENYEVVLNLKNQSIRSKTRIKRGQPAILMSEYNRVSSAVLSDKGVIEAIKKRGIDELEKVFTDTWGPGELDGSKANQQHRILRNVFYYRGDATNPYARPIAGLSTIFDVTENRVVEVIDSEMVKLPQSAEDFFDINWIKRVSDGVLREGAQNVQEVSKEYSFSVNGNEISWQGFRFLASWHPREGLVISQVGFEDKGQFQSILYRGALSEMVVPYGDPDSQWYWRCAFDEGDYGVGNLTNSLQLGTQVPASSYTLGATFADNDGLINTIPNAIAIFEREGSLLWSHSDDTTGRIAAQMGKELVVMSIFTIGNYDYANQWVFKQDGTIEVNAILTGVLAAKAVDMAKCGRCEAISNGGQLSAGDRYGAIIGPNLVGPIHQHFFNFRLDFAMLGSKNSIAEIRFVPVNDAEENPRGNAFTYEEEILKTEQLAASKINATVGRHWWIFNPNMRNSLGHFPGYVLEPLQNAMPYAQAHAHALRRASFLQNQFWVTAFHPREMNAAGDYPSQNLGDGLTRWTKRNADTVNKDIVIWYTFAVTHLPRAEDWPVMPATKAGFLLKPKGFFERNPALNVVTTVPFVNANPSEKTEAKPTSK